MQENLAELYDVELQESKFADLVASIVDAKINGYYDDIEPTVAGGWHISQTEQTIQKAETIANAVVQKLESK